MIAKLQLLIVISKFSIVNYQLSTDFCYLCNKKRK